MHMPSQYWLVSLPISGTKESTWKALQDKLGKASFDTQAYKLHIPDLRVGTLDSLLAISDDLVKANAFVDGVTKKISRQIEELDKGEAEASTLAVDGVPIDSYITRFVWDEAKYPIMTPLRETVETIHESVSKLEDDLKVRVSEYNTVKGQLNTITRKAGGSMAVRDLSDVVKQEDVVESEHLTTLLVIVSKFVEKDWLSSYETLSTMVVPRSSKRLTEDNEYALYTVTLFKKVADTFKVAAREKGFQVRDYEHNPDGVRRRREEQERLTEDQENMRATLHQWCNTSYGEVFSSWMHICCIRLFAESILRYGLPPAYMASVLAPSQKSEKKVRALLDTLCGGGDSSFWKGDSDASMAGLTGGDSDLYPYVSFTMSLT
eukprot:jgi/Mesen1/10676/ME000009S10467